jgi:hypothetical protein
MKRIAGFLLAGAVALAPMCAEAGCDKAEAKSIVDSIVQGGLATRRFVNVTTYYIWKKNWYSMPYKKQYNMINGLAGVEQCLRGGPVTTRIVYMGEEVAKGGPGGVEVMKSRP